ncbi:type II toxin-antitoxin system HipA family toxin [Thalassomonas haliotis]|uniref:Type II toxin-antitoxin system HipA family toxin n=1 Tax=Thalassomonas haliotis TaxID=485448 RepID=A0ABY7VFV0_9GAMM|nr:type II toxin-antitoxin system HipA family toxin [Thalassomonas haliotis]WDE12345.1 type II toxin-antitoxin system HipA family toxin [Thalassomonas haliotis]
MTSRAYVFIDGLEDEPIICGVVELDDQTNIGKFRYGQSYLQRPDAFALDPLHLPLHSNQFATRANRGMFGAVLDAGADSWGKKLIYSLHKTKPKDDLELVLAGSGTGVGALTFSLSRTASKPKKNKNTLGDMPMLLRGKDAILKDEEIPEEAKKAFEFGSSMGGARPKTVIEDKGKSYLAKFNRSDDLFNVCLVEHATMNMLREIKDLNMRVAETSIVKNHEEDILLVERFDCRDLRPSHHFLSANSILGTNKVTNASLSDSYTYGILAEFIMKHGAEPRDSHELFARMVFNILMGNTDDHSRNHAFVYSFSEVSWRLSPAYDVLPVNNTQQHGIGIGNLGRFGSIENALSQSRRFGLTQSKAKKIADKVQELTMEWRRYFSDSGVSDADIERLKGVIPDPVSV